MKVLAVEGNRIRLSRKAILKEQRAKMGGGEAPPEAGEDRLTVTLLLMQQQPAWTAQSYSKAATKARTTSRTLIAMQTAALRTRLTLAQGKTAEVTADDAVREVVVDVPVVEVAVAVAVPVVVANC